MNPKIFCLFVGATFLFAIPTHADGTTIVDITATRCDSCLSLEAPTPVDLEAQLTVEAVTGQFFNSGSDFLFTGTVDEVIAITGTFNGNPITFFQAPQGEGSWLYPNSYALGSVYFMAGGSESWLENDNAFNLIETLDSNGDGFGTNTPIVFLASDPPPAGTPEPSPAALLATGLLALLLYSNWRGRRSCTA
jgi:hypothetical protein